MKNKIEANDRTITAMLSEKKYTIDYFQREYNWQQNHMEQLIADLTAAFLNEYKVGDERSKGAEYNNYYLGPIVIVHKGNQRSIIDGQQRLTSITLLLIYLNNLQKEFKESGMLENLEAIEQLIFSDSRGEKSFNIQVKSRTHCLAQLFQNGEYTMQKDEDVSIANMIDRYQNIHETFPEELKEPTLLPFFIDWLKWNVVLVEIIAFSDDNAYTIFETMNDRGLNLSPTEMLKGYLLSRLENEEQREQANELWKGIIQKLNEGDKTEHTRFFQAWLRSQYADTIRPAKAGATNQDFEEIGTRFHNWVKDNHKKMDLNSTADFKNFISNNLKFYHDIYQQIIAAKNTLNSDLEYIYYIGQRSIAESLRYPLLLASLRLTDTQDIINKKMNMVARYIETFVVRYSINFKIVSTNHMKYTMYSLVKEIRGKSLKELQTIFEARLKSMDEKLAGMREFYRHSQNVLFIKYLLSRMTAFIEQQAGMKTNFDTYFGGSAGKPYEIEHLWSNKFEEHQDEFDQENEFAGHRNRIGGLILLPNGTNQSLNDQSYQTKLPHYIKENLLAKSLCEGCYQNNPNFLNMKHKLALPFEPLSDFKKIDFDARAILYQKICEIIWSDNLG